jgi:AraC family transcriptional activator of pobA
MSGGLPGFLRGAAPAPIQAEAAPVRCGSFGLALQRDPWRYTLLHDRPADLLLWITRGHGRVIVNGLRRGVSTHSALFLPAGTLMAIDLPPGTQALFVESPAGLAGRMPAEPVHLRIRDGLAQSELTAEIDAMTRETRTIRPRQAEVLAARVGLIAVWLHRQIAAGTVDPPPDTASNRLVRRFAQAVVRDGRASRPVAAHADALDVTPTHLSRVCRAACGHTAADILTERKLHAARIALASPRPAIKDIARDLGFASAAYFSRFVVAHTGQSPRALRAGTKPSRPARLRR